MNVLFINSREPACGVHQFGLNLFAILKESEKHNFHYIEPGDDDELIGTIVAKRIEILFYNFYPCTMPWITLQTLNKVRALGLKQLTIHHEVPVTGFDVFIYPDPTFTERSARLNDWYRMGRPIPALPENVQRPTSNVQRPTKGKGKKAKKAERGGAMAATIPVIGSAGFGFGWKGHERLVGAVLTEFDKAIIRLHLPFAVHGDADGAGATAIAERCRDLVYSGGKPDIQLEISHEFLPPKEFVEWLARNDLNAYLYDNTPESRGIASTIDHALAARKPIAVTRTWMFRHLHHLTPSVCVEDSSLREIMANGTSPLELVYEGNSEKNIRGQIERVIDIQEVIASHPEKRLNRLLTDNDRHYFRPRIFEMQRQVPELMERKIPEANVQQAWALEMVRQTKARRILCVGCFEDSAYETLRLINPTDQTDARYRLITGIDPQASVFFSRSEKSIQPYAITLHEFRERFSEERFECVFATSVIEHVQDDEQFIRDICSVLIPDGVALLTCDFRADWKEGDPLPAEDVRLYTPADYERLAGVIESQACYFLEKPDLTGAPDFEYHGHRYSFATMVFKHL